MLKITRFILYDEPTVPEIQLERMKNFLTETFQIKVDTRKNFFQNEDNRKILDKITRTRIYDLKKPFGKQPHIEDKDKINTEELLLYDGFEFHKIVREGIPENENDINTLHVIFTKILIGTFDESDYRYHARAMIGANPAIISTTGIIEAPAKSKQYYLDKLTNSFLEKTEDIDTKYKGEFLEYHDLRISDIIEGYLLQVILYHETGDAFCEEKHCRLYNAHWQKDLLFSQLESKKFCKRHLEILDNLKN
ncbi:MAG: DUF6775 family putative metallopeptidase [Nitrosopumilus sp.]